VGRGTGEHSELKSILIASDLAMLFLAWVPITLVHLGSESRRPAESLLISTIAMWSAMMIMRQQGLHLSRLCAVRSIEVRLIGRSVAYTAVTLLVLDRLLFKRLDTYITVGETLLGATLMLVLLVVERSVYRSVLRSARQSGGRARDVMVVGAGSHAARLVALIRDHPDYGMRVVALVGDRSAARTNGLLDLWQGSMDDAEEVAVAYSVTGVVLSAAASEYPEITTLVKRLQRRQIHVQVSNGLAGFDVQRLRQLHLAREPMIYLEKSNASTLDRLTKRAIDLFCSIVVLTLFAPVLIACAAAIKLTDRGPVFFKQTRVGRHGRPFEVYKFRTMVVDAEKRKADLVADNERSGPLFKMDVDPRVTKVGKLLRLTSLDEIPQLLNVLRNQMSIVGPRPALPSEVIHFDADLRRREDVKPGITGLWQVEARDSPSFDAYRRLDLFYVDNWTVAGDLEIMIDTLEHLFGRLVRSLRGKPAHVAPTSAKPAEVATLRRADQQSTVA
jgi:exopolysaccharide biosynthesis polyprenyl glycosylphosphotransferase